VNLFHQIFDKFYPAIRFAYENVLGHEWFSEVTPQLWLGGAPTYERDYRFLVDHKISASLNIRAERSDDIEFYVDNGIEHIRFMVPDIGIPDHGTITQAVNWVDEQVRQGRTVLVHCAKGRGRSAAIMAAYLMKVEGMTFDEADAFLLSKRALTKLEPRHKRVLEEWIRSQS
jgi:protein-tyrosine phosphatase